MESIEISKATLKKHYWALMFSLVFPFLNFLRRITSNWTELENTRTSQARLMILLQLMVWDFLWNGASWSFSGQFLIQLLEDVPGAPWANSFILLQQIPY